MRIIDISRELMSAQVYPGDPAPEIKPLTRISLGDSSNTSALHICAHNATHLDAPLHFVPDGLDIAGVELEACVGECSVVEFSGILLGAQAEELMPFLHPRVLFKGEMEISPSAAFVLSTAELSLVGVEAQSVAPAECSLEVHRQMLGSGTVLLEGIDLSGVNPGSYFLFAPPIKIKGCDGAPVRAVLIER
ncbi:MAG: cyclase family protein [Oscillospiraceae bacterium]|nr:cyclase family protein [Oscillospiraceae bacterium]MDD3832426.1 cyclase family protein [Oscillospiraceae bacterium]MDD4546151.1 cyclase family protein [Oscillospiraceae bacterium]